MSSVTQSKHLFPNGFVSWYETFYEVSVAIDRSLAFLSLPKKVEERHTIQGHGGLYELAKELTDKFEEIHKGREWDGEFFDEIEKFLNKELYPEN